MRVLIFMILLMTVLVADHDDETERESFHIPYDMSYLHLSDAQHRQVRTLLTTHRQKLRRLHEEKEALEKVLKQVFERETFDRKLFLRRSLQLKQQAIRTEADFLETLHAILSPEQRKAFARYLEEWDDD